MKTLRTLYLELESDKSNLIQPHLLRGFLANLQRENILMHHHIGGRKYLYKYPKIQYKRIDGKAFILGLDEGLDAIMKIYERLTSLQIGNQVHSILEKNLTLKRAKFGCLKNLEYYSFLTPWLALNEKNYERYKTLDRRGQIQLLNRILIGNILSMAKGLEYVVTSEIKVKTYLKPAAVPVKIKGVGMTGFLGEFQVNFNLPDYIGLGKSVSRGFGTVKRLR